MHTFIRSDRSGGFTRWLPCAIVLPIRHPAGIAPQRGYTLLELMVTLTIAAILTSIAIPNMRSFLQNNRLAGAANDLLHGIQVARTEAIKRQNNSVTLCATTNSTLADAALTCSYSSNAAQWFVFADTNNNGQHDAAEAVLQRGAAHTSDTVKADKKGIICFSPNGFANVSCGGQVPTQNIVLCDVRGNVAVGTNSMARAVFISQTGRPRVSQVYADVNTAITAAGSCP